MAKCNSCGRDFPSESSQSAHCSKCKTVPSGAAKVKDARKKLRYKWPCPGNKCSRRYAYRDRYLQHLKDHPGHGSSMSQKELMKPLDWAVSEWPLMPDLYFDSDLAHFFRGPRAFQGNQASESSDHSDSDDGQDAYNTYVVNKDKGGDGTGGESDDKSSVSSDHSDGSPRLSSTKLNSPKGKKNMKLRSISPILARGGKFGRRPRSQSVRRRRSRTPKRRSASVRGRSVGRRGSRRRSGSQGRSGSRGGSGRGRRASRGRSPSLSKDGSGSLNRSGSRTRHGSRSRTGSKGRSASRGSSSTGTRRGSFGGRGGGGGGGGGAVVAWGGAGYGGHGPPPPTTNRAQFAAWAGAVYGEVADRRPWTLNMTQQERRTVQQAFLDSQRLIFTSQPFG